MIALVALYATVAGALVGAAAWCAEHVARLLGRPTRGVWAGAMALALALPAAAARPSADATGPATRGPRNASVAAGARAADGALAALLSRVAAPAPLAYAVPDAWRRADPALGAAWAAAALLVLARRAVAARRLRRWARLLPRQLVAGVPVRVAPAAGPAVMRAWRPEVVLPAWVLADARLPLVLRHEEEHRRARDPLLLSVAALAVAVVPWYGPLWWLLTRLRAAVEADCDARVLAAGADPGRYARLLLDVAGRVPARPPLAPALAAWRPTTTLERRIRLMVAPRPAHARLRALAPLAGVLALGAGVAALPRPALARAGVPSTTRMAADTGRSTAYQVTIRDSGTTIEATPLDTAGQPAGRAVRLTARRVTLRTTDTAAAQGADSVLVVVNGRETGRGRTAIAAVRTDDIARADVLKGEVAARKYGTRGRHGVIEITTKAAKP